MREVSAQEGDTDKVIKKSRKDHTAYLIKWYNTNNSVYKCTYRVEMKFPHLDG